MTFQNLQIITPILEAIKREGYEVPTPIQIEAIPVLLSKKDMMGSAQTGTGKTAAFAIPILQNLMELEERKGIKALILAPTRELAMQVKLSFDTYGKNLPLKTTVVFGGVSQKHQIEKLKKGVDILVATPGRLLDLMNQRKIKLDNVEYLVLDEADRMLDMGFIDDVKRIVARTPKTRKTMLFSATLPNSIVKLANSILVDPVKIQIAPKEITVNTVEQSLYYTRQINKAELLLDILSDNNYFSVLLFTRTKRTADKVVKQLLQNKISATAIHSDKSQGARGDALRKFKKNNFRVLVATDIASRGIDIDDLSLVINYDLPDEAETYVHRIGRTGRANKTGAAITMCQEDEVHLVKKIERHIKSQIHVVRDHKFNVIFSDSINTYNYQQKVKNNRYSNNKSYANKAQSWQGKKNNYQGNKRNSNKRNNYVA